MLKIWTTFLTPTNIHKQGLTGEETVSQSNGCHIHADMKVTKPTKSTKQLTHPSTDHCDGEAIPGLDPTSALLLPVGKSCSTTATASATMGQCPSAFGLVFSGKFKGPYTLLVLIYSATEKLDQHVLGFHVYFQLSRLLEVAFTPVFNVS